MRWIILIISVLGSGFLALWYVHTAWISATPVSNPEYFKTKAMIILIMAAASIVIGVAAFFILSRRKKLK
jgi:hypothetical protein